MSKIFNRQNILHVAIAAFLYSTITVSFQTIFNMPNIDIRISAFLPPLLGLIWGVPGAIGIAVGNFISDILSLNYMTNTLFVCVLGSAGNFLIAYLPYKLWYSFSVDKSTSTFSINAHNLIKYVLILSFTTLTTSLYLTLIINDANMSIDSACSFFILIFCNNFDISLLLGTPLLLLFSGSGYKFSQPKNILPLPIKLQPYFDILLVITLLAGIFVLSLPLGTSLNIFPIRVLLSLSIFIYCLKPFSPIPAQYSTSLDVTKPLQFKITSAICLFAICSVVALSFSNFLAHNMLNHNNPASVWTNFYHDIFFTLHLIFAALIFFLWHTEKQLILPLQQLSESTSQFADSDHESPLTPTKLPNINSGDEIELLANSFGKMMTDIEHYVSRLKETLAEKERIAAELNIAMQIQTALLPDPSLINERFKSLYLSAIMNPAQEVGGDFYDFFLIDDDNIAIVVADVSGKGIPAALFMTISRTLLHTKTHSKLTVSEILYQVNNELCENNSEQMFTTAFFAIYNIHSHRLQYANAGHNKPLLCHNDSTLEFLEELSGPMLAAMEDISYRSYERTLAPGDLLILYTDGVTEAENTFNQFYDKERLLSTISPLKTEEEKKSASVILLQNIKEFANGAPQSDDITILTLYLK